uniref:Uncharacterized protein n=1 Tax=Papio anubis TaxID=9555 RepID=A0A8I5NQ84_PAPAN
MCHHAQLIFVFLVETGFHNIGQAGLKILTSGDPPASASQNAGITGMTHHARPIRFFSMWVLLLNKRVIEVIDYIYVKERDKSRSVAWAGAQWLCHSSSQYGTPGPKRSSCISLQSSCHYRCVSPCPANYFLFFF